MTDTSSTSETTSLAERLLAEAMKKQQASIRVDTNTPVAALRAEIRALARRHQVLIRTGLIDDVLVVVRADAEVWHEPAQTMRDKLIPDI